MACLRPTRLTRRRKSAELRRQGPPDDRHRHPSAHHCRRRGALSAGAARRPPIGLVAHAAGDGREADRRHGRGRRRRRRRWCRPRPATATTIPTSPTRLRRTLTVLPACSRSTCWPPTRRSACAIGTAGSLTGLRLFTFGSTMAEQANWLDDPRSYPAWTCAGELGLIDLPADVGQGDPAGARHGGALSGGPHRARPLRAAGAGGRAALCGGGEPVRAGAPAQHLPQADAAHFRRSAPRQGDAGDILCQAGRRIRRVAARLGLELSVKRRHAARAARRPRATRWPRCRKPTATGFSPRPRRRSTRRSRTEGTR